MNSLFSERQLAEACDIVGSVMPPTPQYKWPLLQARCGVEVWVKHENHTPTGAFKVRGGLVFLDELHRSGNLPAGFITATRGNHGQSIPFAAARYGVPVTVVVPEGNSTEKNRAMQAWGAELIVHGRDFDEARVESERLALERELRFAPSFHPDLVRGVATYGHELFKAIRDLDLVYVPIGMGSGVCSLIAVRDLLGLSTKIVGVVSSHAPAYALSLQQGEVVQTDDAKTFADGMACRIPSLKAFEIIRTGVDRIIQVDDDEVATAMRALFEDTHNVAEGAGAAALAALLQEIGDDGELCGVRDIRAAVILTGGNVDSDIFSTVLRGETPLPVSSSR